jgi:hypothetical protein
LRAHPRLAFASLAFVCYVLVLVVLLPQLGNIFTGDRYVGVRSDPTLYIWGFAWWPYAITHGINPLITHVIWAPRGANIAWDGDTPGLALLAWPLTALVGPVVSFNIITLSAPVLAALATYLLCYEITHKFAASLVGGWLFGFSTYEMAQLMGHLQVNFIAEIPLLLLLGLLRYRGRIGAPLFIIGSTLLLSLEFGVGVELFTTTALFAAVGLAVGYLLVPQSRRTLARITVELGGAYTASLVLISPYLYFFLRSASGVPPIINSPVQYSADLLNFIMPTPVTALGGPLLSGITSHFTGNYAENDAYLGLPLILIVGLFVWRGRNQRWVWVLTTLLLIVFVAELGPRLHIVGNTNFGFGIVRLPWDVATKIPGLRDALPGRFAMYLSLLVAIMASIWIATLNRERILGVALVLATIVFLWPNPLTVSTPPPVRLLSSKVDLRELGHRATVLFLPYGSLGDSMLWQALDGMVYRTASGTGTVEPASFASSPAVKMFFSGVVPAGYRDDILRFCRQHGVTAIVVTAGTPSSLKAAMARIGWRAEVVGSDKVYWPPE